MTRKLKKTLVVIFSMAGLLMAFHTISVSLAFMAPLFHAPHPVKPKTIIRQPSQSNFQQPQKTQRPQGTVYGIASWYSEGDPFINLHTANGEVFDDSRLTCATWDYKFGTYLKVTNLANGKSVVCRVNDRGPVKRLRRLIDLTKATFQKIANPRVGLIKVSVTPVSSSKKTQV